MSVNSSGNLFAFESEKDFCVKDRVLIKGGKMIFHMRCSVKRIYESTRKKLQMCIHETRIFSHII